MVNIMTLPYYPKQGHDEEINQPGWYKAYFAAFCPGDGTQYDFKVADNWNVISCSKVGGGTHGFCASCAVILIELKHSDFMTCQNSSTIRAGETWTTYYADIRVIDVYNTTSGKIGIRPRGKSETTYNVTEDQTINTSSTDYNLTIKPYTIFLGSTGTKIMQFTLCWEPKYIPPTMCTQTFKLQDQSGNLLNGSVQIGTKNITILGTGETSLEQGKSYHVDAYYGDKTLSKDIVACSPVTFTFTVATTGTLKVSSEPIDAKIFIDDVYKGLTPTPFVLNPGTYNVLLTKDGYDDVNKQVSIQIGLESTISVVLNPTAPEELGEALIGEITSQPTLNDEIKIQIPITNNIGYDEYFYVDLRDNAGTFVEKAPNICVKISDGASTVIHMTSVLAVSPTWNIDTIEGQTVTFELKTASVFGIGKEIVATKTYNVPGKYEELIGNYIGQITSVNTKVSIPVTNVSSNRRCFLIKYDDKYTGSKDIYNYPVNIKPNESFTFELTGKIGENIFDLYLGTPDLFSTACLDKTVVDTKTYIIKAAEEPTMTGKIGVIRQEVIPQIGNDEIKFTIPVTNTSSKDQCYIIKLYNQSGEYIAKAPISIIPGQMANKIAPGATEIMTLDSNGQFWHINDIQNQTVTFKLLGDPSFLTTCAYLESGYSIVDSKPLWIPPHYDPDKDIWIPGDPLGIKPELDVSSFQISKIKFKGLGLANSQIRIYQDKVLEIDELLVSVTSDGEGFFEGEVDVDTGSYEIYAKNEGVLGKESNRHKVLVLDLTHVVLGLTMISMGLYLIIKRK